MNEPECRNGEHRSWAVPSPLRLVEGEYDRLAAQGLPAGPIPGAAVWGTRAESWDELRAALHDSGLPAAVRDEIWVWLIGRSRAHGGDATLMCAVLAVPMLVWVCGRFLAATDPYRHDIESEVLTGFLTALAGIDLDRPWVWDRLRWSAHNTARSAARQHDAITAALSDHDPDNDDGEVRDPVTDRAPAMFLASGDPETVLARAVAAGVLTEDAAELILATRVERRAFDDVAARHGVSHWTLRKQRQRAETRLVAWLTESARDTPPADPTEAEALYALDGPDHPAPTRPPTPHPTVTGRTRPTPTTPSTDDPEMRACA